MENKHILGIFDGHPLTQEEFDALLPRMDSIWIDHTGDEPVKRRCVGKKEKELIFTPIYGPGECNVPWTPYFSPFYVNMFDFVIHVLNGRWTETHKHGNWTRCTDDAYPNDEEEERTVIAWYMECDRKWLYYTKGTCPYGWNILCRSLAYWMVLDVPNVEIPEINND